MAGLFDSEVKGVKPATGGTGLFGNSGDFITKERGQILQEHLYNKENANNPFRAIGGALKTYNLKNSPEVQQMRDTETIMSQIDVTNAMEVDVGYKELMKIGNVRGAVELLQQHKSLATTPVEYKTSKDVNGYLRYEEGPQKGERVYKEEKEEKEDKGKLRYLIRIGEGDAKDRTISSKMFESDEKIVNPKGHYWSDTKTGGGSTVNVDTGGGLKPTDVLKFRKNYQDITKPARETSTVLQDLNSLLEMPASGARDKAIVARVTETFGGKVRALADLQQWRSLGDLGERIAGSLSNFFTGTMGAAQEADFKALVRDFSKDFNSRYNKMKAQEWDFAASQDGLNPRDVIGEDRYQIMPYGGKSYEVDMFTGKTIREVK